MSRPPLFELMSRSLRESVKAKQRAQCPVHLLVPRRLPVSPVSTSPWSSPEGEVGLTEGPEAAPSSPWSAEGAEGARGPTQPSEEIQRFCTDGVWGQEAEAANKGKWPARWSQGMGDRMLSRWADRWSC